MRTRHLHRALTLVALAACSGLPVASTTGAAGGTTPASGNVAADVITYTNEARARNGLRPLTTSAKLMDAARLHAQQMARYQQAEHTISGAQYPTVQSRIQAVGYVYSSIAENVAWNQQSARDVVNAWMRSPGHRANILDPTLTQIGAAIARSSKGEPYWIQVFGTPR